MTDVRRVYIFRHAATFVVLCIWILSSTFISLAYFSDFRGILLTISYEQPIDTLYDLLEAKRSLYLIPGSAMEIGMANTPLKEYKRAHDELFVKRKAVLTFVNGWISSEIEDQVYHRSAALITSLVGIQMRYDANVEKFGNNPFRVGKKVIFYFYSGFVVPKGTPWKADIDRVLIQMVDMGIIERITQSYIPLTAKLDLTTPLQRRKNIVAAFSIRHIFGPLIVLAIGMFVALITLTAELINVNRSGRMKRVQRKNDQAIENSLRY